MSTNYVRFPNVNFEPVELQAGLGEVFRSVTPSFLLKEEEEEDVFTACCPRITWRQRIFGWLACFCLGLLLQASSFGSLTRALLGHPGRFALVYTLGNIIAMVGTFFLAGPRKQMRKMSDKHRARASACFLLTMPLTIVVVEAGHFPGRALLILLMVLLQWMSLVWYTLSYIPYGQKMALKILKRCFSWCCTF
eukprot:TRINITY_DN6915_c0_g1_i1.p1 TRINITY_DN6915_c0_g1~~TRINITY_DN6915_c0_g1_i1.p1  ORF type:complete len:193 (-),score=32.25 TRINITY_DN6915_c0_g1_i1:147-725(-)